MRFQPEHLPVILFLALPIFVSYNGFGVPMTLVIFFLIALLRQFILIGSISR